jgi:hypothetical protein
MGMGMGQLTPRSAERERAADSKVANCLNDTVDSVSMETILSVTVTPPSLTPAAHHETDGKGELEMGEEDAFVSGCLSDTMDSVSMATLLTYDEASLSQPQTQAQACGGGGGKCSPREKLMAARALDQSLTSAPSSPSMQRSVQAESDEANFAAAAANGGAIHNPLTDARNSTNKFNSRLN